jgi:hypothetical protein
MVIILIDVVIVILALRKFRHYPALRPISPAPYRNLLFESIRLRNFSILILEREVVSGVGPIRVRQPRVRHRDQGRFSSAILPRFMRRTPSVDALIPALYLKGISTGDSSEALAAILGEKASGLSATNIVRLKVGSRS